MESNDRTLRSSAAQREETRAILHRAREEGRLTADELKTREDQIRDESSAGELHDLIADLPHDHHTHPTAPATNTDWHVAILGGFKPDRGWRVPAKEIVVTLLGGVKVDFTQAQFLGPETTIIAASLIGGVDITVPEGIRVEVGGFRLLGGVKRRDNRPAAATDRLVRVRSFSILGGVDIHS